MKELKTKKKLGVLFPMKELRDKAVNKFKAAVVELSVLFLLLIVGGVIVGTLSNMYVGALISGLLLVLFLVLGVMPIIDLLDTYKKQAKLVLLNAKRFKSVWKLHKCFELFFKKTIAFSSLLIIAFLVLDASSFTLAFNLYTVSASLFIGGICLLIISIVGIYFNLRKLLPVLEKIFPAALKQIAMKNVYFEDMKDLKLFIEEDIDPSERNKQTNKNNEIKVKPISKYDDALNINDEEYNLPTLASDRKPEPKKMIIQALEPKRPENKPHEFKPEPPKPHHHDKPHHDHHERHEHKPHHEIKPEPKKEDRNKFEPLPLKGEDLKQFERINTKGGKVTKIESPSNLGFEIPKSGKGEVSKPTENKVNEKPVNPFESLINSPKVSNENKGAPVEEVKPVAETKEEKPHLEDKPKIEIYESKALPAEEVERLDLEEIRDEEKEYKKQKAASMQEREERIKFRKDKPKEKPKSTFVEPENQVDPIEDELLNGSIGDLDNDFGDFNFDFDSINDAMPVIDDVETELPKVNETSKIETPEVEEDFDFALPSIDDFNVDGDISLPEIVEVNELDNEINLPEINEVETTNEVEVLEPVEKIKEPQAEILPEIVEENLPLDTSILINEEKQVKGQISIEELAEVENDDNEEENFEIPNLDGDNEEVDFDSFDEILNDEIDDFDINFEDDLLSLNEEEEAIINENLSKLDDFNKMLDSEIDKDNAKAENIKESQNIEEPQVEESDEIALPEINEESETNLNGGDKAQEPEFNIDNFDVDMFESQLKELAQKHKDSDNVDDEE